MIMRNSILAAILAMSGACGETVVRSLPDAPPPPPDAAKQVDASPPGPMTVFDSDFETTLPPSLDVGSGVLTASEGFAPLGGVPFGSMFLRSPTGNTLVMSLTGLPPHTKLSISFLFAAIDSLDGTGSYPAGDFMKISLDGTEVFRESFANATDSQIQSYIAPPGGELARRVDLGFQGPGGYYTDSAYDMGVETRFHGLAHTGSTATIEFTLEGEGVQTLDDESWAIDNLRITLAP